jgi:predicted outer membrane repeat protein
LQKEPFLLQASNCNVFLSAKITKKLFSDNGINNCGSFIKSSKFLPPRERITFGENSSRGSGGPISVKNFDIVVLRVKR